ncbi:MAG: TonB-dependent receptor [Sphingomonadales bacterium]
MNKNTAVLAVATACLAPTFTSSIALAQGVGQRSDQDEIVVYGKRASQTAPGAKLARDILERVPGGIGFVEADVFLDDFAQSIGDALIFTPGVYADTSAQRENRISVRGSGLNATFERRGITVLRDGVPISRASGITEFQEIDPLTIDYIEVFKGANGLRYGAASLGGAINVVTPTGKTVETPYSFRAEGGRFGTFRGSGHVSSNGDKSDFYLGVTGLHSNGFRDHSDVRSVYSHGNFGYKFDNGIETRFYLTALSDNFELSGTVSLEHALEDPKAVQPPVIIGPFFPGGPTITLDPGPIEDDWDRNLDVVRISNKTVVPLEAVTLEAGAWYAFRNLDHAITRFAGVIAQQEHEVGGFARGTGDFDLGSMGISWTVGGSIAASSNDAKRFENEFGQRGLLTNRSDQDARNITLYAQIDAEIVEGFRAIFGGQYIDTVRDNDAELNDVSGRVEENQFSPRFGLLWDAGENAQLYFNASRGFEPAGISDLTSGGILDFTPLKAQEAWTVEIGSRGQHAFLAWDVSLYRSWVENEFIDLAVAGFNGAVSNTFNANDTIHQGVELGVDVHIEPKFLTDAGLRGVWRNIYTYSDFHFDDNPTGLGGEVEFADNDLAGVPEHVYVTELRLEDPDKWYFGVNLRWVPEGPFADYANTTKVPSYALVGLTAGYDVTDNIRLFASAENLFDKNYISNVNTVGNQSLENGRIFTPGQGQAFFGGVTLNF